MKQTTPPGQNKPEPPPAAAEAPVSPLVVLEGGIVMALPVATYDLDATHPTLGNVLQRIETFNLPQGLYAQERRDFGVAWTPTGLQTRIDAPATGADATNYTHSINFGGNTDLRVIRTGS